MYQQLYKENNYVCKKSICSGEHCICQIEVEEKDDESDSENCVDVDQNDDHTFSDQQ